MGNQNKYKTFGKNRSLRLRKFNYSQPFYVYFLTLNARKRRAYFKVGSLAQMVADGIRYYAKTRNYRLIAYCIMPDHVHLLIQAMEGAKDLTDLVRDFKKFTTTRSWSHGINGKLWQRGYYEHIVRKSESISAIAEYILNNPVKKGIVKSREEYPFMQIVDYPV